VSPFKEGRRRYQRRLWPLGWMDTTTNLSGPASGKVLESNHRGGLENSGQVAEGKSMLSPVLQGLRQLLRNHQCSGECTTESVCFNMHPTPDLRYAFEGLVINKDCELFLGYLEIEARFDGLTLRRSQQTILEGLFHLVVDGRINLVDRAGAVDCPSAL